MKYFVMIGEEQRGPYELHELADAGVAPDTYVWCKGMPDWQRADEVADICRFFRQRIFDINHPSVPAPTLSAPEDQPLHDVQPPLRYSRFLEGADMQPEIIDASKRPASTLFLAVMLTIFCFPLTGFVAIYYSFMASKAWAEANRSESKSSKQLYSNQEREQLRLKAHDYNRSAKMWIGITFFLGIIMMAFVSRSIL